MTSGDEKDPPVPADLVGVPKRIHRDQGTGKYHRSDHNALADERND